MSDPSLDRGPRNPAPPGLEAVLGMYAFIAALTMFFGASIVVYLIMRQIHQPWPPRGFPALPSSLWTSTLSIVFSSITMHGAVLAAQRGDTVGLRRNLLVTLLLGLAFLGLQSYAWYRIYEAVAVPADLASTYLKMFYVLTGLHAAHVLGGLVPLSLVTVHAYQGLYGRRKNAGVRYTAIYWHFLDVVWCAVFTVVYLL